MLAVRKWPLPPTVTALRAFLGLANYYHTYVKGYAETAAPLMEKLKLPKDTYLQNIQDEITALIRSTLYKLTLK